MMSEEHHHLCKTKTDSAWIVPRKTWTHNSDIIIIIISSKFCDFWWRVRV